MPATKLPKKVPDAGAAADPAAGCTGGGVWAGGVGGTGALIYRILNTVFRAHENGCMIL
jgi:hypothetical protein